MLQQVLWEIETAGGPIELNDLARRLGVDPGTLEGMMEFWVRRGRLRADGQAQASVMAACSGGACGIACAGPQACPHANQARTGRSYSLVTEAED